MKRRKKVNLESQKKTQKRREELDIVLLLVLESGTEWTDLVGMEKIYWD